MTSVPTWTNVVRPSPPASTAAHAAASCPAGTILVLQVTNDYLRHQCAQWGYAVWRWEGEWSLVATCEPPEAFQASVFAYFDPFAGDFYFGGGESRRIVIASLGAPGAPRVLTLPKGELWGNTLAAFEPSRGTGVLQFGDETYALHPDRAELIAKGTRLDAMAFDPRRGGLVGFSQERQHVMFRGGAWQPLGPAPANVHSTLVFDPGTDRMVCLAQDGEELALLADTGSGWQPLGRRLPGLLRYCVLVPHEPSGSLLGWGGYDEKLIGLGTQTNQTWESRGGDFAQRARGWNLHLGRLNTPLEQNGRLLIADHSALTLHELGAEGWEPWPEVSIDALVEEHDDRVTSFAASDTHVYLMGSRGGAFRRTREGAWERVAGSKSGPGQRGSREPGFAFDETSKRLTLFGNRKLNDTWVLGPKGWKRLSPRPSPPRGMSSAVSTPEGLYLLVHSELWRLRGDQWTHVATEPDLGLGQWDERFLFYDRRRGLLSAASGKGVFFFDGERWHRVAELPLTPPAKEEDRRWTPRHPFAQMFLGGYNGTLAHDPAGDRLVALASGAFLHLPLTSLSLPSVQRRPAPQPAPSPPSTPDEPAHARRFARPPAEWRRVAAQLRWARGVKAPARLPVKAPPGYTLIATLPASGELDLGGKAGLAVLLWKEPFAVSESKAVRIQLFPARRRIPALAFDPEREELRPVSLRRFTDVDPEHLEEVDSTPGELLARHSKVGGYARHIQGDESDVRLKCGQCKARLRFAAQLSSDLFGGSLFGDVGRLFVYVCPKGHQGRGVIESH
jgi:hypothetical protein